MSIDTQDKRTASLGFGFAHRAGTRRPTATTSAFLRGICLGVYTVEYDPAIVTTRLALIGTSSRRLEMLGISSQRMSVSGTSSKRLTIEGASR